MAGRKEEVPYLEDQEDVLHNNNGDDGVSMPSPMTRAHEDNLLDVLDPWTDIYDEQVFRGLASPDCSKYFEPAVPVQQDFPELAPPLHSPSSSSGEDSPPNKTLKRPRSPPPVDSGHCDAPPPPTKRPKKFDMAIVSKFLDVEATVGGSGHYMDDDDEKDDDGEGEEDRDEEEEEDEGEEEDDSMRRLMELSAPVASSKPPPRPVPGRAAAAVAAAAEGEWGGHAPVSSSPVGEEVGGEQHDDDEKEGPVMPGIYITNHDGAGGLDRFVRRKYTQMVQRLCAHGPCKTPVLPDQGNANEMAKTLFGGGSKPGDRARSRVRRELLDAAEKARQDASLHAANCTKCAAERAKFGGVERSRYILINLVSLVVDPLELFRANPDMELKHMRKYIRDIGAEVVAHSSVKPAQTGLAQAMFNRPTNSRPVRKLAAASSSSSSKRNSPPGANKSAPPTTMIPVLRLDDVDVDEDDVDVDVDDDVDEDDSVQ